MANVKEDLEKRYQHLKEIFDIGKGWWRATRLNYGSIFIDGNLIAEYLIWENFVAHAKRHNVEYYAGIDEFLQLYKKAVHSRVKIDEED